jgi:hypothetical protein
MRRSLSLLAALTVLLACSASASAAVTPGHNVATKTLEGAFKIAQFERAHSADGCYPGPAAMAAAIRDETDFRAGVAKSFKSAKRSGVVYVIKRSARCGHVSLAFRAKAGLWALDSTEGTVEVLGKGGGRGNRRDAVVGGRGPLRALKMITKTLRLNRADETQRGIVLCPKGRYPLGGGMINAPPVGPDGEGIYPHSYERLGAQRGWHINPTLFDPEAILTPNPPTTPRTVTLQVVCGKGLVPASAPRKSVFLRSGESGTATARCRKGQVLMAGGFQRTNFRSTGGSFATESRAVGKKAWRVSGRAFGGAGGELTAIAYCDRNKRPLLAEVTASAPLPFGQSATATTPPCPKGRRLTSGGFTANGSNDIFFAGGSLNSDRTWSASAYGFFGPAPSLTAFGYCLRPGR